MGAAVAVGAAVVAGAFVHRPGAKLSQVRAVCSEEAETL